MFRMVAGTPEGARVPISGRSNPQRAGVPVRSRSYRTIAGVAPGPPTAKSCNDDPSVRGDFAMKQCQNCKHYNALTGDPPAGWCEFIANTAVPFWIESHRGAVEKNGADVLATDGADCAAFGPAGGSKG